MRLKLKNALSRRGNLTGTSAQLTQRLLDSVRESKRNVQVGVSSA